MSTGFNFEKTPVLKTPDRQLPPGRAQFELDLFGAELPANNNLDYQSPRVVFIGTVAWRCYDQNPCYV